VFDKEASRGEAMSGACVAVALAAVMVVFPTTTVFAQSPLIGDPQALALARKAISALTMGNAISDVTLTAKITWIMNSHHEETGTATLYARRTGSSRIDLNLPGEWRTEIWNDQSDELPQGESIVSGTEKRWPTQSCWSDSIWFLPALSYLSRTSDPTLIFTYVGQESWNSRPVQHIQVYRHFANYGAAGTLLIQQMSRMDVYLDGITLLPMAILFDSYPDDDATTALSTEVDYANYEWIDGVQVPIKVRKLISGRVGLELSIATAVFNSGLPESLFTIQ
jgi:hypothetical protein